VPTLPLIPDLDRTKEVARTGTLATGRARARAKAKDSRRAIARRASTRILAYCAKRKATRSVIALS
jgi:hypothetical protein